MIRKMQASADADYRPDDADDADDANADADDAEDDDGDWDGSRLCSLLCLALDGPTAAGPSTRVGPLHCHPPPSPPPPPLPSPPPPPPPPAPASIYPIPLPTFDPIHSFQLRGFSWAQLKYIRIEKTLWSRGRYKRRTNKKVKKQIFDAIWSWRKSWRRQSDLRIEFAILRTLDAICPQTH